MSSITFNHHRKKTRDFEVKGWAKSDQIAEFSSGSLTGDIILGEGAGIAFDTPKDFSHQRNKNAIVIAGTGQGKTRSVILPTLISHLPANLIITDTKGELKRATAQGFAEDGYDVLVLDTINPARSCHYNPLAYIESEDDIPSMARLILESINPARKRHMGRDNDEFWNLTSQMLLEALIGLCYAFECIDGKLSTTRSGADDYRYLNLDHVQRLFELIDIGDDESDRTVLSPLDRLVEGISSGIIESDGLIPTKNFKPMPSCFGVKQYHAFKSAANKTLKSIVISLQAELNKLRPPAIKEMFKHDDLAIDHLDEGKRVIYLVMSDNDSSNSFIGRMVFKQILMRTLAKADANPTGKLDRAVMFVCDEFANLDSLTDFERVISIARSRRINFLLCIQSIGQLNYVYGQDRAQIILDNCDTLAFLGSGSTYESADYFSKLCGDAELGTQTVGREGTETVVSQELMSASSISQLPREECIIKISGVRPFRTRKFDVMSHPNADRFLRLNE